MQALSSAPDPGQEDLDSMVDEFNAVQRECRELRIRVVALVDRYNAYAAKMDAAEAAQEAG